jgi:hypothetical protein
VPAEALEVETVKAALADFVDFESPTAALPAPADSAEAESAGPLALHKGLLAADVDQLLGEPFRRTSRKEGTLLVMTRTYDTRSGRIVAEFVEDVLFRYTITSR